ncbi:MAG: stage II sporulation protein D [Bacillota bacterium]|nr:stage II sporulation protein D [Bacillota bacterium]
MARIAILVVLFALVSVLLVPSTVALLAGERLPAPSVELPPTPGAPPGGWPGVGPAGSGGGEAGLPAAGAEPSTPLQPGGPAGAAQLPGEQTLVTVYDEEAHRLLQMPLETYVEGVVAAEMPAGFAPAALQAQAVAARTFAVARLVAGAASCPLQPRADFCSDGEHGQAWASPAQRQRFWGVLAPVYEAKIRQAVEATAGQILLWQGRPIEAFYTASAGGRTASAKEVFGLDLPYLPSLPSPDADRPAGLGVTRLPLAKAAQKLGLGAGDLQAGAPAADGGSNAQPALAVIARTPSGRAAEVRVGDRTVSGEQFRQLLGLPSTLIESIGVQDGNLVVQTRGYGHGVGLSQYGAGAMARQGYSAEAILAYYYPGTRIAHLPPGPV